MKKRGRIDDVPDRSSSLSLFGPLGVKMEVAPHGDRWEWRVWLTFDGRRSLCGYSMGSWRKPGPHEVRGRCRDQGQAWERARAAVEDVRRRHARVQSEIMQTHRQGLAL